MSAATGAKRRLGRSLAALASVTALSLLATGGCATQSAAYIPSGMRVAAAADVAGCKLIGDVHGVSGLYGVFGQAALSNARQDAFQQAAQLGANTVVWSQFTTAYGSTAASGFAYRCPADAI